MIKTDVNVIASMETANLGYGELPICVPLLVKAQLSS